MKTKKKTYYDLEYLSYEDYDIGHWEWSTRSWSLREAKEARNEFTRKFKDNTRIIKVTTITEEVK